jgi:hypothetical protein
MVLGMVGVPLFLLGLAAKMDGARLVDETTDGAGYDEDDEEDFGCFRHNAPPGLKAPPFSFRLLRHG